MRKGPAPSTVPHGEAPTAPDAGGSTKKRKRAPNESAALGANAAKRAAIAAEAALGPLPTIWKEGATRRFVPWLMPEGLFDDDRPGERWAAHPDYPPSKLLVSYNYGVVRTRGHAAVGAYECFTQGSMGKQGYRSTKHKYVHILVCEAFHGPKPPGGNCTVDHGAKYNGDFMRERSDNRACNLKWATPREQLKNQKAHSAHSNGVPVLARLKDSTDDADWCSYASSFAAGKALGISPGGIISAVLDETKKNTVTRPAATCSGTTSHRSSRRRTYWPRSSGRRTRATACPSSSGSSIRRAEGVRGRRRAGACRRRIRRVVASGPSARRGPLPARNTPRLEPLVHRIVWRTFCPDDPPVDNESIDHKDRDEGNNALWNLRRATKSEQTRNRTIPLADDIIRPRTSVLAWKDGDTIELAERFVGQHALRRVCAQWALTNDQVYTARHFPVPEQGMPAQWLALCVC